MPVSPTSAPVLCVELKQKRILHGKHAAGIQVDHCVDAEQHTPVRSWKAPDDHAAKVEGRELVAEHRITQRAVPESMSPTMNCAGEEWVVHPA